MIFHLDIFLVICKYLNLPSQLAYSHYSNINDSVLFKFRIYKSLPFIPDYVNGSLSLFQHPLNNFCSWHPRIIRYYFIMLCYKISGYKYRPCFVNENEIKSAKFLSLMNNRK